MIGDTMSINKIIAPTECPSCGAHLERVKDQLFCPNYVDCPAQSLGKLLNFFKKLKIKGFGEATLTKLGFRDLVDVTFMCPEHGTERGLSPHMAQKLTDAFLSATKQIDYKDFLAACSIPLIGTSAASKLNVNSIEELTYEKCRNLGLGEVASENLSYWVMTEWSYLKPHWENNLVFSNTTALSKDLSINVVITGKLNDFSNRTKATEHLTSLGFTVKSSVSKNTDYLICEDGSQSSSVQKANSLNIPIVTIKYLEDNYVDKN